MRTGDSLLIVLRPTGLKHISPSVWMKYTTTSHQGDTRPAPVRLAAMVITPKAIPANIRPNANFAGLDGCRSPIVCQMKAKTGARKITNIAGTDCHQLEGNDQPNTAVRLSRSANSVMLEPACSYVIQKMTEKTTRIKITSTRLSSSPFNNLVVPPRYPMK